MDAIIIDYLVYHETIYIADTTDLKESKTLSFREYLYVQEVHSHVFSSTSQMATEL